MLFRSYSDSWADPGKQNIPSAWTDFKDDLTKMKAAVAEHTKDVLKMCIRDRLYPKVSNESVTKTINFKERIVNVKLKDISTWSTEHLSKDVYKRQGRYCRRSLIPWRKTWR